LLSESSQRKNILKKNKGNFDERIFGLAIGGRWSSQEKLAIVRNLNCPACPFLRLPARMAFLQVCSSLGEELAREGKLPVLQEEKK
jgi:hypothetical protein